MNSRIAVVAGVVAVLGIGALALNDAGEGVGDDVDGGLLTPHDGGECCWRPAGAPVESCLRRNPHTDVAEDIGDETTMPATNAVGAGCVPRPCSLPAR